MPEPSVNFLDRTDVERLPLVEYERREYIRAAKIDGPFVLRTDVGDVFCEDGYAVIGDDGRVMCFERKYLERHYETARAKRAK